MVWTEARLKSFITSVLRAGSRKYPPKWEVLHEAYTSSKVNERSGRLAKHYKCAKCGGEFTSKDVEVDHIKPIVDPKRGFVSWDEFIANLFCSKKNLQCLCTACHKAKTLQEREQAKQWKSKQ
jgi:5-methylcytosine-specific restriction endonuclease McrA